MLKIFFVTIPAIMILLGPIIIAQNLPQNPIEGREIFEKKGCMNCHAINGVGGNIGPDFGKHLFVGDEFDLFSKMWNHSPRMLLLMSRSSTKKPEFTSREFENLSHFLFFIRYLGTYGSVSKGKRLFTRKECVRCHSIGHPVPGKIPLDSMKIYASPVRLAQAMWDHSFEMWKRGREKGIRFPTFSDNEFADLVAYIRATSSVKLEKNIYSYTGDPAAGEKLFKSKGCYYCHVEKQIGPDLTKTNLNHTVTQIAGIMWNHSEKMLLAAKSMNKPFPELSDDEMANLIAYLYFESSPKTEGTSSKGRKLFKEKGCESCHQIGNELNAPLVENIGPYDNVAQFLAELWNHVTQIEQSSLAEGKRLPVLLPNDVKSLYLFINEKAKKGK
ncbi:MAG: c-type cytochrome [Candidatus Kryptoniota bacterium]